MLTPEEKVCLRVVLVPLGCWVLTGVLAVRNLSDWEALPLALCGTWLALEVARWLVSRRVARRADPPPPRDPAVP